MPTGNGSKPATQADIEKATAILRNEIKETTGVLRNEIKETTGVLRNEIKETTGVLRNEIKETSGILRSEIRGATDALRDELKADIRNLDNKIDAVQRKLIIEIVKTNGLVDDLRQGLDKKFSQNTDRILTHLDKHAKIAEANNRAVVIHGQALTEQQRVLNNHEGRLASLESKS